VYRDQRTSKARAFKWHLSLLVAQYKPASEFLLEIARQVARMRVGRDEAAAAVDDEVARQAAQREPRGRDQAEAMRARGRKVLGQLRKRWALERDSCQRAEDRLAGLCADQVEDLALRWTRTTDEEGAA
jgi:hypothetical protein